MVSQYVIQTPVTFLNILYGILQNYSTFIVVLRNLLQSSKFRFRSICLQILNQKEPKSGDRPRSIISTFLRSATRFKVCNLTGCIAFLFETAVKVSHHSSHNHLFSVKLEISDINLAPNVDCMSDNLRLRIVLHLNFHELTKHKNKVIMWAVLKNLDSPFKTARNTYLKYFIPENLKLHGGMWKLFFLTYLQI